MNSEDHTTADPAESCVAYHERISLSLDGELTGSESADLEVHLAQCTACREIADQFMEVDFAVSQLSLDRVLPASAPNSIPATALEPSPSAELSGAASSRGFLGSALWRLVPLAVAASVLICLAIATWPSATPATADQIPNEQFVKPLTQLQWLNGEQQRDQALMLKTLLLDLRAMKLEVAQLENGSSEQSVLTAQIDAMMEKVSRFEGLPSDGRPPESR